MSAKVRKIIGILDRIRVKYLFSAAALLLFAQLVFGSSVPRGMLASAAEDSLRQRLSDSLQTHSEAAAEVPEAATQSRRDRREQARAAREQARRRAAFEALPQEQRDSLFGAQLDSLITQKGDSLEGRGADTIARDTVKEKKPQKPGAFLDDPITGKNKDSLVYDVRNKMVYIYNEGDITYQNSNLKADYMQINMDNKMVYAYGKPDSLEGKPIVTKPEFSEGDASYTMDTITYNLTSKKAKIKGVATQQGDGWLVGGSVKKMPNNTVNIQHGKYTTCDETDHPHFYLAMTKAKVIPGKKVVTGPAYLVMEDVPIYFLGIPEGFFPINMGPKSGLLMPTYGEEYSKGFFLRDMGYYFTLGDYADLAVRGGIYTLGSWEASAASRYIKRYKYSGSFNMQYSNIKTGEKGEPDYIKQSNFRIQWTHSQDPKANPGSTFSASVNFATSGYSKYSATNLNDILSTQTNSSIAYSKNWAGTPFSLSANMSISQNSQNKSLSVTLPTVVFNVSRFYPFKRKERMGKERWYEKISMQYTGKMTNSVTTTEDKIFSKETLDNMKNGIEHNIPISASFNLFNYINISPSATYNEKWYFKKVEFDWNPVTNKVDTLPTQYGFYRLYNYNFNVSASTTVYGMYDFTKKRKDRKIQAIRHTLTPSIGFAYTPDFGDPKYGYYKTRQTDSTGRFTTYSPYSVNAYGVPSSGPRRLDGLVVRLYVQIARRPLAIGHQRHHQHPARIHEPLLRPLRQHGSRTAAAIHVADVLRFLTAVELRVQLCHQLQHIDGQLPAQRIQEERHADRQLQRQPYHNAQDRHHVPGRLRHQGEQTHHLVDLHLARPALLADVVLVDTLRVPPQLELQHRRKGGIAFRPQIRQEPVDVRQYVLNPDPRLIHPPFHPRQSGYRLRQCGTVVVSRRRHRQQYAKQTKPGRKTDVCVYILTGNRNFTIF